ncbi:hypothetical protein C8R45DRAFT_61792 [Mycena sanguinolenta]|nr:hypothetical protein C8R45DRAFT_61792 [Mycena sanguinolenta]
MQRQDAFRGFLGYALHPPLTLFSSSQDVGELSLVRGRAFRTHEEAYSSGHTAAGYFKGRRGCPRCCARLHWRTMARHPKPRQSRTLGPECVRPPHSSRDRCSPISPSLQEGSPAEVCALQRIYAIQLAKKPFKVSKAVQAMYFEEVKTPATPPSPSSPFFGFQIGGDDEESGDDELVGLIAHASFIVTCFRSYLPVPSVAERVSPVSSWRNCLYRRTPKNYRRQ